MGAGLLYFTGAHLKVGVDIVMDTVKMEEQCIWTDLVISGEGLSDYQTAFDKAPVGLAKVAKKRGKAVLCLSGALGFKADDLFNKGIDGLASAVDSIMTLDECMNNAYEFCKGQLAERFAL